MQTIYQCCFCGNSMNFENESITSLIVTSNWNDSINSQQEQQLFCHMECLKENISDKIFLYLSDLID